MAEYIERERLTMGVLGLTIVDPMVAQYADAVLLQIQQAPAADVAPVVHAKWAYNINDEPYCEACGELADLDEYEFGVREKIRFAERPYCSHCGARMDGE